MTMKAYMGYDENSGAGEAALLIFANSAREAKPGWGRVNNLLHAWSNMIYWPILGRLTGA